MTSAVPLNVVRLCVMDPVRRICESHQFHFHIVLQSISQPQQRFWTASKQLSNILGDWFTESATYVEGLQDEAPGVSAFSRVPTDATCAAAVVADTDLKLNVEEEPSFTVASSLLNDGIVHRDASVANGANVDDDCVMLPSEMEEDETIVEDAGDHHDWNEVVVEDAEVGRSATVEEVGGDEETGIEEDFDDCMDELERSWCNAVVAGAAASMGSEQNGMGAVVDDDLSSEELPAVTRGASERFETSK